MKTTTKQNSTASLRWLGTACGRTGWWLLPLTLLRVLQSGASLLFALTLQQVIDCAAAGNSKEFSAQLLWLALLGVATVLLGAAGRYTVEKCKTRMEMHLRLRTFSQLLRRDYATVTAVHTGEWMNRITSDTSIIAGAASSLLPEVVGTAVSLLGALFSLHYIAPTLTYILVPSGLLLLLFSTLVRKKLKTQQHKVQQADGRSRSFMQEQLSSQLAVRVFVREDSAEAQAKACTDRVEQLRMRRTAFSNLCTSAVGAAMTAARFITVAVCGTGILRGMLSLGTLSAALYLANMLEMPFARLSGYISRYAAMLASIERLMEPESFLPGSPVPPLPEDEILSFYDREFSALRLEAVSFSYGGNYVLKDLDMTVRKQELVSFTGSSGTGKSTAMKTFLCLYPLAGGQVCLEKKDGTTVPLSAAWRSLFAYVPQGNLLVSGTIRETITFGDAEKMRQDDLLHGALKVACADEFVSSLPQGLDTPLGERGSGLSEGQLQRLAIARAMVSGRPILLLDEATSALDSETEARLLENLRSMTDRTAILITHREHVAAQCDRNIFFPGN